MTLIRWLAAAGAAFTLAGSALAETAALQFHADWCGNCKKLAPKLVETAPDFAAAGITLTKLDFTEKTKANRAAQAQSAAAAGGAAVYDRYGPKTGFVVFYDTDTGAELDRIEAGDSVEEIRAQIAALAN